MTTTHFATLTLLVGLCVGTSACKGPEQVLLNKMYSADIEQITVVGDEELTRFNRWGAEQSDEPNNVVIRFYEDDKMQIFWLGGIGIMGTYQASAGSDGELTASVDIPDDRFGTGTATIDGDGSAFDLEFEAPIVGYRAGSFSDCSTVYEGKPICTRDASDIESQTRVIRLHFEGEADSGS